MNKTEIVNVALSRIGTVHIEDVTTDTSVEAIVARDLWDISRIMLLELMDWSFARKRAELARDATAPEFGYAYRYTLPADNIKIRSFYTGGPEPTWEAEDGFLLTDEEEVFVIYTYDQDDTSKFTPGFCTGLSLLLAANMAVRLVNDSGTIRTNLLKEFEYFSKHAMKNDATEGNEQSGQGNTQWSAEGR